VEAYRLPTGWSRRRRRQNRHGQRRHGASGRVKSTHWQANRETKVCVLVVVEKKVSSMGVTRKVGCYQHPRIQNGQEESGGKLEKGGRRHYSNTRGAVGRRYLLQRGHSAKEREVDMQQIGSEGAINVALSVRVPRATAAPPSLATGTRPESSHRITAGTKQ
jgi:hypothetical protein